MPERFLTIEQVLTILAGTPPRLAALTDGLAETQLHTPPSQGEWSANEVLAHLRACADVWGKGIAAILAEDVDGYIQRPTIRAVSPRTWIKKTDYPQLEFQPSLRAFTTQRADPLAVLEPLPPEGWSRTATILMVGRVFEGTVLYYGDRLARHECEHLRQIEHIVNIMHL